MSMVQKELELRTIQTSPQARKCHMFPGDTRLFFVCWLVFQDRVSLCSLGCPGTHSVDQAGLELRNPPVPASQGVCHHFKTDYCPSSPTRTGEMIVLFVFLHFDMGDAI